MTGECLAYWAVVEHHRWWLATDGCHRAEVKQAGKLTVPVAERIAREYGVARTIGSVMVAAKGTVPGLPSLVEAINRSEWPDSLEARANICIGLADDHLKLSEVATESRRNEFPGKAAKTHTPTSGVTKLMWFLRPEGWTMFDKFARIGLIGSRNEPLAFYRTLDEQDFVAHSSAITKICNDAGFSLSGERIIDKMLLFRGSIFETRNSGKPEENSYFATARVMNNRYLELLPDDLAARLRELARAINDAFPATRFPHTPSPSRKKKDA